MSNFYNNSWKKVTLKYTTTHKCSTSKTIKSNSYLTSAPIQNYTSSDNFSNTTYELYVPSIDNEQGNYARKDGEESLNSNHNRSTKKKLKRWFSPRRPLFLHAISFE